MQDNLRALPFEIQRKIILYSHPILDMRVQDDIRNHDFITLKRDQDYCIICEREHRLPRHFRC